MSESVKTVVLASMDAEESAEGSPTGGLSFGQHAMSFVQFRVRSMTTVVFAVMDAEESAEGSPTGGLSLGQCAVSLCIVACTSSRDESMFFHCALSE